MRMLLAGDIGGTNTRLGLFAAASPRPSPVEVRTYETGDFPTLESMLAAFLAEAGAAPASISGAAFGVAGPVVHGRAALTNADWQIDASRVAHALGVPAVRLLNDLIAMANAIAVLAAGRASHAAGWRGGPRRQRVADRPGHGARRSAAGPHGRRARAVPVRGWPRGLRGEDDARDRSARVPDASSSGEPSTSGCISGPGLVQHPPLRSPLAVRRTSIPTPPTPPRASRPRPSKAGAAACVEALDIFVAVLGAECGNSALRGLTTGGVYLGGGIPPKIIPALESAHVPRRVPREGADGATSSRPSRCR